MRLILVRHGHVEGIAPPRFRGRADLVLSELGQAQALAVAGRLRERGDIAALYCSPQRRAMQTAEAIGETLALAPLVVPDLEDIDYGAWQGQLQAHIDGYEDELDLWRRAPQRAFIPGGETLWDVAARATHAIGTLVRRHPEDAVVVVAHDSVNRVVLLDALDLPLSRYRALAIDPCSISEIEYGGPGGAGATAVVECVNDTAHLAGVSRDGLRE